MKLFKFTLGIYEGYGVFEDEKDAFDRRGEIDAQYEYLPVEIDEVRVEGYNIVLEPIKSDVQVYVDLGNGITMTKEEYIEKVMLMDKKELHNALMRKDIQFHHALGEEKLRELVIQNI